MLVQVSNSAQLYSMEVQNSYSLPKSWAKLIAITKNLSNHQLYEDYILIGRNSECHIILKDRKLSKQQCLIYRQNNSIIFHDLSTNGCYINGQRLGQNNSRQLSHQDEISLLPPQKVKTQENFTYRFEIEIQKSKQNGHHNAIQQNGMEDIQPLPQNENNALKQQITCPACSYIILNTVACRPCNHIYCGGCLSKLLGMKKYQCMQCLQPIQKVERQKKYDEQIQEYLKNHPQDKRNNQDEKELVKANFIGEASIEITKLIDGSFNTKQIKQQQKQVMQIQKQPNKPTQEKTKLAINQWRPTRKTSDITISDDENSTTLCRQCLVIRNGFKCGEEDTHVKCQNCQKYMPNRNSLASNQYCEICCRYYCNLYFPPCKKTGNKLSLLQTKKDQCAVNAQLLRNNLFQFQILRNYLVNHKMKSKDIFMNVLKDKINEKRYNFIIDKRFMKTDEDHRQIPIMSDTCICDDCWKKLWFQIILEYRIQINDRLPPNLSIRPNCQWGVNCKTMNINSQHAKKFNHMTLQTRFQ